MTLALYMDHHVPRQITQGLRLRGIDVITALEDDAHELEDADLLKRATELSRVLFTRDDDLLVLAREWQTSGVFSQGLSTPINCVFLSAHVLRISRSSRRLESRTTWRIVCGFFPYEYAPDGQV